MSLRHIGLSVILVPLLLAAAALGRNGVPDVNRALPTVDSNPQDPTDSGGRAGLLNGLDLTPPKGWSRVESAEKGVMLAPPDASGQCGVTIVPASEFTGTAEEWQESVWKLLTENATLEGERTAGTSGRFRSYATRLTNADGQKAWMKVYTVLEKDQAHAVILMAATEKLFATHSPAVDDMTARAGTAKPAFAVAAPIAGGLSYPAPADWLRDENPAQGFVRLAPPGLPDGSECAVFIYAPGPHHGTADQFLEKYTAAMTQAEPIVHQGLPGSVGGFRAVDIGTKTHEAVIYAAVWDGRVQVVIFMASHADLMFAHGAPVETMLRQTVVPGFTPAPSKYVPAPIPAADKDVKVVGAWLGFGLASRFRVGESPAIQNHRDVLLLFANGVAVRADVENTGRLDTTYFAEGFATLDVSDPGRLTGRSFGRWQEADGSLTIEGLEGGTLKAKRDGDNLKGEWTWNRLQPVDGKQLAATFEHAPAFGRLWSITLRADGTFLADGINQAMGGLLVNPGCPVFGSGTYEFRKWSLILRFDTGFVQSSNMLLGSTDAKTLVINGYSFDRKK